MTVERRCVGCFTIKNRDKLIRITSTPQGVIVNKNSKIFGRSAYLCYNKSCIESALKKNKLAKIIKAPIPETLKGQLLDELRNG